MIKSCEMFPLHELFLQLAAIPSYHSALRAIGWPSLGAQRQLVEDFNPRNYAFLASKKRADNSTFSPPISYQRAIFRYLEKSIEDLEWGLEKVEYDDDFIENCVMVMGKSFEGSMLRIFFSGDIDPKDIGYASYPLLYSGNTPPQPRIPFLVKRAFHQVGTKVWGAGLFLAELFQYMTIDCNDVWRGKVLFELGSGVGITGILVGRGLPSNLQPHRIIMTDCFDEVLNILNHNISLIDSSEDNEAVCDLSSEYCNWSSPSSILCSQLKMHSPHCIFAADCTYSEDLNLLLISLFELYLTTNCSTSEEPQEVVKSFLPTFLLKNGVMFVLIACTIRHPDTFNHFKEHLFASPLLQVADISEDAHKIISTPLYTYDFRENIRLFCITARR